MLPGDVDVSLLVRGDFGPAALSDSGLRFFGGSTILLITVRFSLRCRTGYERSLVGKSLIRWFVSEQLTAKAIKKKGTKANPKNVRLFFHEPRYGSQMASRFLFSFVLLLNRATRASKILSTNL